MKKNKLNKKIIGVLGAVAITFASSGISSNIAEAASVKVQSGDTLWKIASQNKTTVSKVKQINGLKSDRIYVGQTLVVSKNSVSAPSKTTTTSSMYTVKRGDSLSKIGKQYGVSYQTIKTLNGLKSDRIYVGQRLKISGSASVSNGNSNNVTSNTSNTSNSSGSVRSDIISLAKSFTGVPYVWGGSTPKGFDCSGFIYYVLKSEGLVNSRTSTAGYWSTINKISNPQPGDLVFFQNTYKPGPSHMGIYLGNKQFIHAGSKGITISSFASGYWSGKFLGYGTVIK